MPFSSTIVELRNDLLGQRLVKIGTIHAVLFLNVVRLRIRADGEAVRAVVAFAPPAVKDAEVEAAVATGFHAAGAGSFERTPRIVQPDIAAGNHLPRNVDVVVFDEHQVTGQFTVFAQVNDLLDESFAFVVAGMRLAGKYELDWPLLVVGEIHDVFELLENQRRALVGGEAPRKADGQRVGVQQMVEVDVIALGGALALDQQTAPHELNHLAPQMITQRPQFLVRNEFGIGHAFPEFVRVNRRRPVFAEFFAEDRRLAVVAVRQFFPPEMAHGAFHPAEQVNAVGDVADGDFFDRRIRDKGSATCDGWFARAIRSRRSPRATVSAPAPSCKMAPARFPDAPGPKP